MAKVFIEESNLTAIGDAIRAKTGKSELLNPVAMPTEIEAIQTGGGDFEPVVLSGDCGYACKSAWTQFFPYVSTDNITNAYQMFGGNNIVTKIPFVINLAKTAPDCGYMFYNCPKLEECPTVKGNLSMPVSEYNGSISINSMFCDCHNLRTIPYDYFRVLAGSDEYWTERKKYGGNLTSIFSGCYSLRQLPDLSMLGQTTPYSWYALYTTLFRQCYTLDEIRNIPVLDTCSFTDNVFGSAFDHCSRAKEITFQTNEDGTPIVANWSNQTIDLSTYVGYTQSSSYITKYNSGITNDKCITDATTYAALKDDPDWWATSWNYSRYNHDSAVNTINSLPDVSGGSGNTIKFTKQSGTYNGGNVGTLTEEEIAIATAKGWTVSIKSLF